MTQILLIRPGTTEYDQQGRVQGTLDIPLSDDGRQQVVTMVAELRGKPIAAIYSCPCQSAVETAEAIADAMDVKVKTLDRLQNVDHGLWQGMLIDDLKVKQPKVFRQWQEQPDMICPPRGETLSAAKERVQATLAKLLKKHRNGELIAIIAPEPLGNVIRNVLGQESSSNEPRCCDSEAPHWQLIAASDTAAAK